MRVCGERLGAGKGAKSSVARARCDKWNQSSVSKFLGLCLLFDLAKITGTKGMKIEWRAQETDRKR